MNTGLSLGQQQTQNLSPQMRQSLQMLQATAMELQQIIGVELAINPVLEVENSEISLDTQDLGEDHDPELDHLSQLDEEWRAFYAQTATLRRSSPEADERRRHMMESLMLEETLQEHLVVQIEREEAPETTRAAASLLLGYLDERGYLTTSLEDLAESHGVPIRPLEDGLALLQSLDPPGVGARSLSECLRLQLQEEGAGSLAERIVTDHLPDLGARRFPQLARKLGVTVTAVAAAADRIASLEPWPGRQFQNSSNSVITPEVSIRRDMNGQFVVTLPEENLPRLRISNHYRSMLADPSQNEELRQYVREKIKSGKFLIQCVHQRQQTLKSVAEEILACQRDYFERGPAYLKPLTMARVAEAVGVHETTVSRAVSGKFTATPYGVVELKSFFTSGLESTEGAMSNSRVKLTLTELIKAEDPFNPLSDEALTHELNARGVKIKRRTVAKYREEMHVLPSHLRRQYE